MLSGLVGLTAPHPDGCRADKSGSPQSESWSRLRFGPVLVLEAPLGAPRVVGANVQIGTCLMRWADGGLQERESVGRAGRLGRATGRGGRNFGSGGANRHLPGTAVSAEGVAKHMCGHWIPVPRSASGTWLAGISPDLSDLLHSERHPLPLFFVSSQPRADSKFQQLKAHVAMPTPPSRHPGRNGPPRSQRCQLGEHILIIVLELSSPPSLRKPGAWASSG